MERNRAMAGLRARYQTLLRRLDPALAGAQLPTVASHDGAPHVEWSAAGWSYIITDRGQVQEVRETTEREELLYWLFADITFSRAVQYELRHRIEGQDFRRILFARQLRELAALDDGWAARRAAEIEGTLRAYPYRDDE